MKGGQGVEGSWFHGTLKRDSDNLSQERFEKIDLKKDQSLCWFGEQILSTLKKLVSKKTKKKSHV